MPQILEPTMRRTIVRKQSAVIKAKYYGKTVAIVIVTAISIVFIFKKR